MQLASSVDLGSLSTNESLNQAFKENISPNFVDLSKQKKRKRNYKYQKSWRGLFGVRVAARASNGTVTSMRCQLCT